MRVIAGTARSMPLSVPAGKDVRPTIDRYKETVFNMINNYIPQGIFLDLFSGSGSIGIEAISRGAQKAIFVENNATATGCIEKNLLFTKLFDNAELLKYDYSKALMTLSDRQIKCDVIYMDPPFNMGLEEEVMTLIASYDLLQEDGIIVIESGHKTDMSFIDGIEGFEVIKERVYNTCRFTFVAKTEE